MGKKSQDNADYNEVRVFEAKPNKSWPDWMTERIRFLKYYRPVACAACGKKSKNHWTSLSSFRAVILGQTHLIVIPDPTVHLPLTPVCGAHPFEIVNPVEPKKK